MAERNLAGIGEIANISNAERRTPNAERRTPKVLDRPVGHLDINFFGKVWKNSSAEFIDADFIEKKFALLISLKKISTVDFIEKNFSNPKTDRPVVFKPQTPNPKPRFSRTDRSFLSSFPTTSRQISVYKPIFSVGWSWLNVHIETIHKIRVGPLVTNFATIEPQLFLYYKHE